MKFLLPVLLLGIYGASVGQGIEWEQNYGGPDWDYAREVITANDGSFVIVGATSSNTFDVSSNNGGEDYWIVKVDSSSGNILWEQNYGGSSDDVATSIRETTDNGYIVAGNSSSSDGDVSDNYGYQDFWVLKLNSSGNMQWEQNYGGMGTDVAEVIQQTTDGGFIVAGQSSSDSIDLSGNNGYYDSWIIKLDSSGSTEWQNNYGGSDGESIASIQQTMDGGFITAGYSSSSDGDISTNYGISDYWVTKLDSAGMIQWKNHYGGSGTEKARSIQQTMDGGYVIVGQTESSDGDVSANITFEDYWVVKIDSIGNLQWEENYGGSDTDYGFSIEQTSDAGFILAGRADSDDGDLSNNHGASDFWVLKLDTTHKGCLPTSSTLNIDTCESYTVPSGDSTYTHSGTYIDTILNNNQCDSILTINLAINNSSSYLIQSSCKSYTVPSGNNTYTTSGTYKDTISNSHNCDSVITIELTINNVNTSVTQTNATLEADEIGASYQWLDCENNMAPISGEFNQKFTASSIGSYAVEITENGCTDTSACKTVTDVGVWVNGRKSLFTIYPSPAQNQLHIDLPSNVTAQEYTLHTITGQRAKSGQLNGRGTHSLDVSDLAPGMYLLEMKTEEAVQTRKVVIGQ